MSRAKNGKTLFNEATRVQMPALVHLTRLGYKYFGKISEETSGVVYFCGCRKTFCDIIGFYAVIGEAFAVIKIICDKR